LTGVFITKELVTKGNSSCLFSCTSRCGRAFSAWPRLWPPRSRRSRASRRRVRKI